MVKNPIENGSGNHMISEDISPFAKGFISNLNFAQLGNKSAL
jgi:hypothetical protein